MVDEKTEREVQGMKDTLRDEASRAGETLASEARTVAGEAAEVGREHANRRFEQGRERVGGEVEAVGSAVDRAAQRLHDENSPLASYADELAEQISHFSSTIQNTSLEDLAGRTRRLARENPGLFMMGSILVGVAASRFFKASEKHDHGSPGRFGSGPDYGYDRGYGSTYGGSAYADDSYQRGSDAYREGRRRALENAGRGHESPLSSGSAYRDPAPFPGAASPERVPMDSTSRPLDGTTSTSPAPAAPGSTSPASTSPAGGDDYSPTGVK